MCKVFPNCEMLIVYLHTLDLSSQIRPSHTYNKRWPTALQINHESYFDCLNFLFLILWTGFWPLLCLRVKTIGIPLSMRSVIITMHAYVKTRFWILGELIAFVESRPTSGFSISTRCFSRCFSFIFHFRAPNFPCEERTHTSASLKKMIGAISFFISEHDGGWNLMDVGFFDHRKKSSTFLSPREQILNCIWITFKIILFKILLLSFSEARFRKGGKTHNYFSSALQKTIFYG